MAKARRIQDLRAMAPTGENARAIVRTRLEELYLWQDCVDAPYHVCELHDMRIAAKRLRYTLEIFEEVLPAACQPLMVEVEHIQEELGALHDDDVMIALLRLCLGAQDAGSAYASALASVAQRHGGGRVVLNPEMLAAFIDPAHAPSAEQRLGLEQLLLRLKQQREQEYSAFRRHWHQLQASNFRQRLLQLVAAE